MVIREGRQYVFDKLPANSMSQYLEVSGNYLSTPTVAAAEEIVKWLKTVMAE